MRATRPNSSARPWQLLVLLSLLLAHAGGAWAQSTTSYAFSTNATGSLVDMSSGATDALAASTYHDDDPSAVLPIGFSFVFMGTPYTQFSVNSNGQLRLGATVIAGSNTAPTAGLAILAPMSGDNAIQATGRLRYKVVTGTNRTLVVEWTGLRVPYAATPAAGTPTQLQVILEENTGKVEYRYGGVFNNGTGQSRSIFISAGAAAGQIGVVKTFTATPAYDATVTTATTTALTDNAAVAGLNSAADGARRVFLFTPPQAAVTAPGIAISAITQTTLTATVTDNSTNEFTFSLYRSTDNVTFALLSTVATPATAGTGGTVAFTQSGLTPNTTYYYRATANAEGVQGTANATTATLAAAPICGTKIVGPSAGADYPSLTTVFTNLSVNGLCGPLVLELQPAYVSTVETFPLVYSYTGGSATNTVTVRPQSGATSLSISSAAAYTLSVSGGKYLVVDGRPGGSGSTVSGAATATDLVIANTSTTGVPLNLASDAAFNAVQHCQVKGVGSSVSYPNVNFSGTAISTGNSDNLIQYNNIGDGASTPTVLVYSGSTTNARNTVLGNSLFNFYGTSTAYGVYLSSAGPAWSISGNSLYQTASRVGVTNTTMYGLYIASGSNHSIADNYIGGSAASAGGSAFTINGTAVSYRFVGIYLSASGTASSIQNNTIANFSWLSTSGATTAPGVWAGLYLTSDANVGTATGNTVGTGAGGVTVTTTVSGGISYGIVSSSGPTTLNLAKNTISNLTAAGSTASIAASFAGIQTAAITTSLTQNKIYNLTAGNAGISTGILVFGGTTATISNNLIGDLKAPASTSATAVAGINVAGGTTANVYFNTIGLSASGGTTFGSSGIYLSTTGTTADLRDNIVVNKATPGSTSGLTVALRRTAAAATGYASTSNNNLYYAGTAGANRLLYYDGTNSYQTLAALKGGTGIAPRETASVSEDVPFLSTTGTAGNFLHINPATATQAESGGAAISGITTDFDGDTRNASTPDIGADEGTFTPNDQIPPTIAYTALANTGSTASRTLTATITDVSGIATGAGAPLIYYRSGTSGGYFSAVATSSAGSAYTFTIDYANIGGTPAAGTTIQYYVAAQDASANNNSGTSPVGGSGTNPPGSTAPTTPNSYQILTTLSGDYYVLGTAAPGSSPGGAAREYATLTAAVTAYNGSGLAGAVRFLLFSNAQGTETYPITINANGDASATNTLTIKPYVGVATTFANATTASTLKTTSASYVIIDGSNTAGGTTRDLTLSNTSTAATAAALVWVASTTAAPSTGVQVRNLALQGTANTGTSAGVMASNTTYNLATGASANGIVVANNAVQGTSYGIVVGNDPTAPGTGLQITNNLLGPATAAIAANIGVYGLFVQQATGPSITGNTVQNVGLATATTLTVGMNFAAGVTNATVASNTINGVTVTAGSYDALGLNLGTGFTGGVVDRNKVLNIVSNTSTYGGRGIDINTGSAASSLRLSNNFVAGINGSGYSSFASDAIAGIRVLGTTGGVSLYDNSVNLSGSYSAPNNTNTYQSAALYVAAGATALDVRNNILANTLANGTSSSKAYALYSAAAKAAFTLINYNDYFVGSGSQAFLGNLGGAGTSVAATGDLTALAAFQAPTGTGQDANSVNADPSFTSATDLHTTTAALNAAATPIAGILTDIDGDTRDASTPDIGADEFTPASVDVQATALLAPATTACYGAAETVTVTVKNNSAVPLDLTTTPITVTVNVTGAATQAFSQNFSALPGGATTLAAGASANLTFTATLDMSATGTYTFAVAATASGDGNTANDALSPNPTRAISAPLALPYLENFNASTTLPTGYVVDTGVSLDFAVRASHGTGTTASNGLSANLYNTNPTSFATTPVLGQTTAAVNQLTFAARFVEFNSYPATATTLAAGDKLDVQVALCGGAFTTVYTIDNTNYNGTGLPSTSFYTYTVPLTGVGSGQRIQVKLVATSTRTDAAGFYLDVDDINVRGVQDFDAGVVAITQPAAPVSSSVQPVAVQVRNYGAVSLSSVTVSWTVNGVAQTPQTFTGLALASGATSPDLALGAYDFSTGGPVFTILATSSLPNGNADGQTSNDAFTRVITPVLAGLYTVGVGQQFATLTSAVNTLNSVGVAGAVTFSLTDASYTTSETFPISINTITGGSAVNTVAIKPASGVTAAISGSSTNAILKLNGADYVTIDGSNTAGGTSRNLSLTNTSTSANALVVWLASVSATNGATNNVVKNLNVTGGTNSSSTAQAGIGLLGTTKTALGQNNDGNTVQNNFIAKVAFGIDAEGTTTEVYDNLVVVDNVVGPVASTTALNPNVGILLYQTPGVQVTHNTVQNARGAGSNYPVGIYLDGGTANALINRNTVRSTYNVTTSGWGARGISLDPGPGTANITVRNNEVSGTLSDGDDPSGSLSYVIAGIDLLSGNGYSLYNNSVQMSGDRPNNTYTNKVSAAVFVTTAVTGVDLRNNVLSNIQTTSDPDAAGVGTNYAVYSQDPTVMPFTTIDYNLYDVRSGAAARTTAVSPQFVGHVAGSDYASLAAWKVATLQDGSSMQGNPGFISATSLAPNPADPNSFGVNGTGTQIGSVAQDLNGNPRSTTVAAGAPDLGAYEVTPTAVPNDLDVTGTPTLGGTQTFSFNGRTVATIAYGAAFTSGTGALPTALTAKYYPGTNPPAPFAAGARYYNAYFTFAAADGSDFTYTPTLAYDPALLGTIATEAAQRVSQQTATGYGTYFATVVNTSARTLNANAALPTFGLLAISDQGAPLPVELSAFTADRQGSNAALAWTTATEKSSRGFEVQLSTDGRTFRGLDFVASATPTSTSPRSYSYLDREAGKTGLRYYRLRQLDVNGTASFSPVRTVRFGDNAPVVHLTAAPNPFHERLTLAVELPANTLAAPAQLTLTDAAGRVLLRQLTPALPAGLSQLELPDLAQLASGVYIVKLAVPGHPIQHLKVVKE